jgi:hypothetical protein
MNNAEERRPLYWDGRRKPEELKSPSFLQHVFDRQKKPCSSSAFFMALHSSCEVLAGNAA